MEKSPTNAFAALMSSGLRGSDPTSKKREKPSQSKPPAQRLKVESQKVELPLEGCQVRASLRRQTKDGFQVLSLGDPTANGAVHINVPDGAANHELCARQRLLRERNRPTYDIVSPGYQMARTLTIRTIGPSEPAVTHRSSVSSLAADLTDEQVAQCQTTDDLIQVWRATRSRARCMTQVHLTAAFHLSQALKRAHEMWRHVQLNEDTGPTGTKLHIKLSMVRDRMRGNMTACAMSCLCAPGITTVSPPSPLCHRSRSLSLGPAL